MEPHLLNLKLSVDPPLKAGDAAGPWRDAEASVCDLELNLSKVTLGRVFIWALGMVCVCSLDCEIPL